MTDYACCILFATHTEAAPLIDALAATPTKQDNRFTAHLDGQPLLIQITGMGPEAVSNTLENLFTDYPIDQVINAGIAGALHDSLQIGEVHEIEQTTLLKEPCGSGDPAAMGLAPALPYSIAARSPLPQEIDWIPVAHEGNAKRLLSVTAPLFDAEQRQRLARIADLVDMEGATVAAFCRERNIPCTLFKGVSDFAASGEHRSLHDNLVSVSQRVRDRLLTHLSRRPITELSAPNTNARLSFAEALHRFSETSPDAWSEIGRQAGAQREARFGRNTTYIHNLQINPSNSCVRNCRFCGFAVLPGAEGAYSLQEDAILKRVEERRPSEVHIVGGLNEEWDYSRSLGLIDKLHRRFPQLYIKAFTAVEIDWFAHQAKKPVAAVLQELQQAGLDSLPGGGAEIFSERLRKRYFPRKISAERWLEIHETAHGLDIPSNATMLYGLGETLEERIAHLFRLRDLQDRTQGFQSFIPLPMQGGIEEDSGNRRSPLENLQVIAMSRLILDNIPHIKAYWPMLGVSTAAVALSWGADDLDGTIGRERIAHAAGAESPELLAKREMEQLIRGAGFEPVERDGAFQQPAPLAAANG